jgi:hypothetical protein
METQKTALEIFCEGVGEESADSFSDCYLGKYEPECCDRSPLHLCRFCQNKTKSAILAYARQLLTRNFSQSQKATIGQFIDASAYAFELLQEGYWERDGHVFSPL